MRIRSIIGHKMQITRLEALARGGRIPQSMIFAGPAGIGKKALAREFISSLFCTADNPPCGSCAACARTRSGAHQDFIELAPNEKGSIPIGNEEKREEGSVRWLIERLSRKPLSGRYGVIVDGIESISIEGQNALLKTIEEPPESTCIILIASSRTEILPTIRSRCFEMEFFPLDDGELDAILGRQGIPREERERIIPMAGGTLRCALPLADAETMERVRSACAEISSFLSRGEMIGQAFDAALKHIGAGMLLDIALNVYGLNMRYLARGRSAPPEYTDVFIRDLESLLKVLKILLALKRGQVNNLNLRIALKAMLYSVQSGAACSPLLDNAYRG